MRSVWIWAVVAVGLGLNVGCTPDSDDGAGPADGDTADAAAGDVGVRDDGGRGDVGPAPDAGSREDAEVEDGGGRADAEPFGDAAAAADAAPPFGDAGPRLDPRVVEGAIVRHLDRDVGLAPMRYDGRPLAPLLAWAGDRVTVALGHQLWVYDVEAGALVERFDLDGPVRGLWVVDGAVVGLAVPGAPLAVAEGGTFAARALVFRLGAAGLETLVVEGSEQDAARVGDHLLIGVLEAPDGRIPFDDVDSPTALLAVDVRGAPVLAERFALPLGAYPNDVGVSSVGSRSGAPPEVVRWSAEAGFQAIGAPAGAPHQLSVFGQGVAWGRQGGLEVRWWGDDGWSAPAALPTAGRIELAGDLVFEVPTTDRAGRVGTLAPPDGPRWLGPLESPAGLPAGLTQVSATATAEGLLVLWNGADASLLALYGPTPGPPVVVSPPLPPRARVPALSREASTLLPADASAVLVSAHAQPTRLLQRAGATWVVVDDALEAWVELYAAVDGAVVREGDRLTAWRDGDATDLGWAGPTIDVLARVGDVATRWANQRVTTHAWADALRAASPLDETPPSPARREPDLVGAAPEGALVRDGDGFSWWPVGPDGRLGEPWRVPLPFAAQTHRWYGAAVDHPAAVAWGDALLVGPHVVAGGEVVDLDAADEGYGWFSDGEAWWWAAPDDAGRVTIRRVVDPAAPRLEAPIALPGRPLGTVGATWVTVAYHGRVEADPAACPARPAEVSEGCLNVRARLALHGRQGDAWVERAALDLGRRPVTRAAVGGGAVHVQLVGDDRLQSFHGLAEGRLERAWTAQVLDPIAEFPTDTCCSEAPASLHALPDGGVVLLTHAGYRAARWDAAGDLTLAPRSTTGLWGESGRRALGLVEGQPVVLGSYGPVVDTWLPPGAAFTARPAAP
ncbi:MAG: hypothetical protein H6704_29995 [Myxococcales bacterium]|nr:hypothetical protein [Myxococcales bacterium]